MKKLTDEDFYRDMAISSSFSEEEIKNFSKNVFNHFTDNSPIVVGPEVFSEFRKVSGAAGLITPIGRGLDPMAKW